jgi:hypothetical protein
MEKRNKSLSLERRLINNVVLRCQIATPRVEEMKLSATYSGNYKDTESDASSYLFEIESTIFFYKNKESNKRIIKSQKPTDKSSKIYRDYFETTK